MKKGFTLLEILIVISIISILVLVFLVSSKDYTVRADLQKQKLNAAILESAIKQHKLENESLPFGSKITKELSKETKKIIEQQLKNKGISFDEVKDSFYIIDKKKIKTYIKGQMADFDRYFSSNSRELEGMVFTYNTIETKTDGIYSGSYVLLETGETGGNETKPPEPPAIVCNSDLSSDGTIRLPKNGSGSRGDPYILSTIGELQGIKLDPNAVYKLGNDIEACVTKSWNGGRGFEPLPLFQGNFESKGFTIKNLYINRPDEDKVGLFSGTNTPYVPLTVKLQNPDITGRDDVGSVVAVPGATNETSYSNIDVRGGKITGKNNVGGIFGRPGKRVLINNSNFTGQVKGSLNVGGIVGLAEVGFNLEYGYFIGDVIGGDGVGGIGGKVVINNGYVTTRQVYVLAKTNGNKNVSHLWGSRSLGGNIYNLQFGNVYYDKDKTNNITEESYGGVFGLTTGQMKNPANYTGTFGFGTNWTIDPSENDGYPILKYPYLK